MPPVGVKEVVAGVSQGRPGCDCSEDPDSVAKNEVRTRTGRVRTKTLAQRSESVRLKKLNLSVLTEGVLQTPVTSASLLRLRGDPRGDIWRGCRSR